MRTLDIMLSNLIKEPQNSKFHKIKSTKKQNISALLDIPGGQDFVEAMGYRRFDVSCLELDLSVLLPESDLVSARTDLERFVAEEETQAGPVSTITRPPWPSTSFARMLLPSSGRHIFEPINTAVQWLQQGSTWGDGCEDTNAISAPGTHTFESNFN